jgi:Outer membrane receptor proteins, mostly Fe transport
MEPDRRDLRLALCLLLLAPIGVRAQAPDGTDQLAPVVVTAQKMSQTLQQVPASVSSLDSEFIRRSNASSFNDLQYYLANTDISLGHDSGVFTIRGFGTQDTNAGFDPSVGTVIDGVFYNRPQFLSAFFFDPGHFDVLRGPQGTLYGRNSTAGLFEFHSAAPQWKTLLRTEMLFTDYGERSFRPVLQLPLSQTLAMRLSANLDHGNRGVLHNTALDRPESNPQQNAVRLRLRWIPGEPWLFDLEAFVATANQNNNIFQLSRVTPAMLAYIRHFDPQAEGSADNRLTSENFAAQQVTDIRGFSLRGEYDLPHTPWGDGNARVVSITGLAQARTDANDLDADFTAVPFITDRLIQPSPYRQFSQELRFSGAANHLFGLQQPLRFVTGLYFAHAALNASDLFSVQDLGAAAGFILAGHASGNAILPPSRIGTLAGGLVGPIDGLLQLLGPVVDPVLGTQQNAAVLLDQRSDSWAWYGQLQQTVIPHWAVIGGLRFGWERKQGIASSQAQGVLVPLISDQRDFGQSLHMFETDFSPRIGLKWKGGANRSAYLTWTRGFKSGGFNARPLNPDNLSFQPERVSSYELGAKTRGTLLGRPVEVYGDLFWESFSNLQVSTLSGTSFQILNAAAARSRGFESDLRWLPTHRTALYASAGFADARYTRYPNAPAISDSGQATQNLGGKPLAFAPRWSLALVPSYTIPLAAGVSAQTAFDVLFKSARFLDIDDDPRKRQPATTLLNARISFGDRSRLWALSLAAHNLTNRTVLDQIVNVPLAPGNFAAVRNDYGRYYSADLRLDFD